MAQHRKRLLADYRVKLKAMKEEEKMRSQEILRQKQLENLTNSEEVALVKMRLDDQLGGVGVPKEKLETRGASRGEMKVQERAQNIILQEPNQPRALLKKREEKGVVAVEEMRKMKLDQDVRKIKRSIFE